MNELQTFYLHVSVCQGIQIKVKDVKEISNHLSNKKTLTIVR